MSTTPSDPEQPYENAPPPPSFGHAPSPGQPYEQVGPPQPGPYPTGPLMNDADQRMWATLAHLSPFLFSVVGPLVVYLLMKDKGEFIRRQSLEALNFQITLTIVSVSLLILGFVTFGIGWLMLIVVAVAAAVFMILASIAANRGEEYRYPLTLRLVN